MRSLASPLISNPLHRQWLRQIALFLTIMLSGGNLLFPRTLMAVAVLGIAFLLRSPATLLRGEYKYIWLLLLGVVVVTLIGAQNGYTGGISGRTGAFFVGFVMLAVYAYEGRSQLVQDLLPMLRFMAFQAIVTPILAAAIPGAFKVYAAEGDTFYRSIFFIFTYHDLGQATPIMRPNGFFWEPGVFQIYLNLFFFIAAFYTRKISDIALAVLGIILIQSTTGMLVMSLTAMVAVTERWRLAAVREKMLWLIAIPMLLAPIAFLTFQNFDAKVTGVNRGSALARMFDATTGLNIVAQYPLAGIGFDPDRYVFESFINSNRSTELRESFTTGRMSSNGIIDIMVMMGLPMAILLLLGLFRQRFFSHRPLIAASFVLSLLSEPLMISPFFLMLAFSGWLSIPRAAQRLPRPAHYGFRYPPVAKQNACPP